MNKKHIFVTVGTTKFDKLISAMTNENILNSLIKLGYSSIQFQTGNGNFTTVSNESIEIKYKSFFENFEDEIKRSDLVISHAGAGSCLEVLQCGKPLIVVINEDLMDNHQYELAEHLSKQGHLYYCTCESLEKTLSKDLNILEPYPKVDVDTFGKYLNGIMRL
ncbi:UDP-N-acetylglucosamine transferase subunit ALG13 homolog [Harmonia axyridis]|uniref:UDP-N-acetylglucosamine transferase subunit ALG13 homolog n=1 Tax=Harmonia axyridis TaxID=115357 RepID=UPI001E279CA4|nr:UDP-N-acetylglucosamine transferase subunit ALG13 homolog [Harmonia axyridis]